MLLLPGEGLESCPQEYMALHARQIKEHIGVSYAEPEAPVNNFPRERVPLEQQMRFVGF